MNESGVRFAERRFARLTVKLAALSTLLYDRVSNLKLTKKARLLRLQEWLQIEFLPRVRGLERGIRSTKRASLATVEDRVTEEKRELKKKIKTEFGGILAFAAILERTAQDLVSLLKKRKLYSNCY